MLKTTPLRISRISFSLALVAAILGVTCVFDPGFCQSKENKDGVTVQKNSDGSVDAYDTETVPAEIDDGGAQVGGDGRTIIHYKPGTSPYEKHYSDGTTVKRNSDGSIETWDAGETSHWTGSPGGGSSGGHHRATRKKSSGGAKTATKSTTSVKKKTK